MREIISSNERMVPNIEHTNEVSTLYTETDVCVIVTCYNETLAEIVYCLNAILKNNIPIEAILLINDNPRRIIRSKSIKKMFSDIQLIDNKNNFGISYCRNLGLDYCASIDRSLIAFCDADDTWMEGKISSQLSYINRGYKLVSSGMHEINYFIKLTRIPNVDELRYGGNPIFLSSVLMKRPLRTQFRSVAIEDRVFFQELIKTEFPIDKIKIIPRVLIHKYNYFGRRGADIFATQFYNTNSPYNKIRVFISKLFAIKGVKVSFMKFLIFHLLKRIIYQKVNTKRVALSINFRSSEYKNLTKFSITYNIPVFLKVFLRLAWEERNRAFFDADTFKKLVISIIYGKLAAVRYAYIGLSGARFIKEYVEIPSETKKIHVVHGRNMGEKYNTYTDAALTQVVGELGNVPARKLWYFKARNIFEFNDDIAVWFHGFKKGTNYSIKDFIIDFKYYRTLSANYKKVLVAPHPLAHYLKIYLRCFTRSYLTFNVYTETTISCCSIYSSSPSISNSEVREYAEKEGIKFISLLS